MPVPKRFVVVFHLFLVCFASCTLFFALALPSMAYTTNMNASLVIGQSSFTGTNSNQFGMTKNGFYRPSGITSDGKHLFISDYFDNRILVYNSLPTTNDPYPDVVIGQTDFSSSSVATTQTGLRSPESLSTDGTRLFVADAANRRTLIYNSAPTTNGAPADVVIGQPNMTTNSSGTTQSKTARTSGVFYDKVSGKLFITDYDNSRVLIYNRVPTTNSVPADVVVGQTNFTSSNQSCTASTLLDPVTAKVFNGKLFIVDQDNLRVLIYNSIPTTNGVSADVVIGQINFTTCNTPTGPSSLYYPMDIEFDGQRLFIIDQRHRVLVYNSIPTANYTAADIVIGQSDFNNSSANQGGSVAANTLSMVGNPEVNGLFYLNNQLFVADTNNNRVLVFNNNISTPMLSLLNTMGQGNFGTIRLSGSASVDSASNYTIKNVEYLINGGAWNGATAKDGGFSSAQEDFYFDFDPKTNNYQGDGYTARVRATSSNLDQQDNLFYFQPFGASNTLETVLPSHSTSIQSQTGYPAFTFMVNHGRLQDLKDSLSQYEILIRRACPMQANISLPSGQNLCNWTQYLNIPVDYETIRGNEANMSKNREALGSDGVYEDKSIWISYTNGTSTITTFAKELSGEKTLVSKYIEKGGKKLHKGVYQWKAVAVDRAGHMQETDPMTTTVNTMGSDGKTRFFPLTVASANLNLSSEDPNLSNRISTSQTSTTTPTLAGIAVAGSTVTLALTNSDNKTYSWSTVTNPGSRYVITIPRGILTMGKNYQAQITVTKDVDFNSLPPFTLQIMGDQAQQAGENNTHDTNPGSSVPSSQPALSPTLITPRVQVSPALQVQGAQISQANRGNPTHTPNETFLRFILGTIVRMVGM
jgi:hypothetical protein